MNSNPPLRSDPQPPFLVRLREVVALFFKLGCISYGGPAAHIALIEQEVVRKRQWLTQQQFLDLLGAANLIPGPTSTEMAINIGFVRAGWPGLCLAGASFIVPAALITAAFAWAYVRFGALPEASSILGGIKAAVIAIIAIAVWRLGKTAVRTGLLAVLAMIALALFLLGNGPLLILLGGGLLGMAAIRADETRTSNGRNKGAANFPAAPCVLTMHGVIFKWTTLRRFLPLVASAVVGAPLVTRPSLGEIARFFLKVGAVLYGGGYVLLAFLDQGLVHQHPWLTQKQLLDAVAIGQFTPGPVLSTATFIGYLLGGFPGAVVATIAIFFPSFVYVALLAPILFKLRQSPWMAAFLDSVNVCAVALMAGVTIKLAADALRGWPYIAIAAAALIVLSRWKINSAWIVFGGGIAGWCLSLQRCS